MGLIEYEEGVDVSERGVDNHVTQLRAARLESNSPLSALQSAKRARGENYLNASPPERGSKHKSSSNQIQEQQHSRLDQRDSVTSCVCAACVKEQQAEYSRLN